MRLEALITIVVALFGSQGLWTYILYKAKKRDERHDLRRKADLVILHDLIYRYCQTAILRGYTTFGEFDNVTALYQVYEEIGGNGTGKKLYEEYCKLPKKQETLFDKELSAGEKH